MTDQGATVQPILSPDPDAMRLQLPLMFGGEHDGAHDGLLELGWTDGPDPNHPLRHARLYGTDEIEELTEEACRLNRIPGQNVYIGTALRKPGTFPGGRAAAGDAYALPAFYVDLDEPGIAELARSARAWPSEPVWRDHREQGWNRARQDAADFSREWALLRRRHGSPRDRSHRRSPLRSLFA
jgi:hypothetical protein